MPPYRLAMLSALLALPIAAATLTGETSKPTYSVFLRGEPVSLLFRVEGLQPRQEGVTLTVVQTDVDGARVGPQHRPGRRR